MKTLFKISVLTLSLVGMSALANVAPVLRGEITKPVHHANNANLLTTPVAGVPSIRASISQVKTLPTILINADKSGTTKLDVTLIDDLLDDLAPNARHYPTNFPNRTAEHLAGQNIKHISDWIEPYANAKDASLDVLIRAAKINGMARNLNIGDAYSLRANNHMAKVLKLDPNHAEANFLYGMMISEAGGFSEGKKYLDKAVNLGYVEAEQSLAQADLLSDKKDQALSRLKALQNKHPDNTQITEQIKIVENGGFYIWNIANNQLNLKPVY
ncbi:tetratricopeptide repeat protein [Moraxella oblonga]|uniref:tetratricopeptide repeat protein n=1 Tax=Moraxella oblonga TaxID=200413 RepID=UPI0008296B59|nr:hypothetical protein [Moraxella oblonga]